MAEQVFQNFETLQLHAGYTPDPHTRSTAVPIYATSSYTFNDSAHGARLFGLKELGNIYSRLMNPTVDVFEKRIAALEGGIAAAATSSGQAAQFLTIATLAKAGDNIVASSHLYGGTYNQLNVLLPRFGIKTKFVRSGKLDDYAAAIDDQTRAIYVESMSNLDYVVPDFEGIAKIAHEHGIPLVVNNTLGAGGYYIRPIEHGADIVVHSATKWIGGHGTTIGRVIVNSGRFNWNKHSDRFPEMVEPSPSYHGLKYWEASGPATFITRIRVEMLRDIGASERHAQNTEKLAKYFESSPNVSWVLWPGSESHPTYAQAKKYLTRGFGAMLSIGVKGDASAGSKVVDGLKLVSNLANLSEDERLASGVTEDMIRISVGIEHVDDIIADFEQSFQKAYGP
ncbi:hypothetical protein H9Q72_003097 [Fusarium xylarioides]|uniref:Sulfhydrylase FUB7 n=1 Tax=Fusarium xylarioides TaxID=221167 RepID=A0A9P7HZ18_9HYPO|nr:hypothetical protein H9Q72_003097 [Fusarium xylarioides]